MKVGDFGLVTAAENQPESSDQSPASKASAKHTAEVGTQLYMSPEQVQCTHHTWDTFLLFGLKGKSDHELFKLYSNTFLVSITSQQSIHILPLVCLQ